MSTFRAPSERRSVFNPSFYASDESAGGATQEELDGKVAKINGFSSNQILTNPTFVGTVSGIAKSMVGLSSADNTSDQNKPVSLATKQALDEINRTNGPLDQTMPVMPDDVIAYYDFSNREVPGYDYSGRGRHLSNPYGAKVVDSVERTNALALENKLLPIPSTFDSSNTATILENDNIAAAIKVPSFSISFWMKATGTTSQGNYSIFSSTNPATSNGVAYPNAYSRDYIRLALVPKAGKLYFASVVGNVAQYNANCDVANNSWFHICITTSIANGVRWYVNGVLVAPTVITAGTVRMDLVPSSNFVIGGSVGPTATVQQGATRAYSELYRGLLSDFLMVSRELSASDVAKLYNDDYGYSIITIAGQSNAQGCGPLVPGVDDDYSGLQNVYQYKTNTNVLVDGTAVVASVIVPATNPLYSPSYDSNYQFTGFWHHFCKDLLKYAVIPWRRKILLIPAAKGGSSLSWWAANATGSNILIRAFNDAMSTHSLNSMLAFLWHQGESDIQGGNLSYKTQFLAAMASMQTNMVGFGPNVPKITGEVMSPYYDAYVNGSVHMKTFHRTAMLEICAANPSYRYVRTGDLFLADGVHFDAPSLRAIGSRYFDAFMEGIQQPSFRIETSSIRTRLKNLESVTSAATTLGARVTATENDLATTSTKVDGLESAVYNVTTGLNSKMSNSLAGNFPLGVRSSNISMEGGDRSILNASIAAGGTASGLLSGIVQDGTLSFVNNGYYPRIFSQVARRAFTWAYMTAEDTFVEAMSLTYNGSLTVPGAVSAPVLNTTIDGVADSSVGSAITSNKSEVSIRTSVVQSSANLDYTGAGTSFHSTLPGTIIMDTTAGARTICLDMPAVGVTDTLRINRQLTIKNTGANSVTIQTTTGGGVANFLAHNSSTAATTLTIPALSETQLVSFRNGSSQFQWKQMSAYGDAVASLTTTVGGINTRVTNLETVGYFPPRIFITSGPYNLAKEDLGRNIVVRIVGNIDVTINMPSLAGFPEYEGRVFHIYCEQPTDNKRVTLANSRFRSAGVAGFIDSAPTTYLFPAAQGGVTLMSTLGGYNIL